LFCTLTNNDADLMVNKNMIKALYKANAALLFAIILSVFSGCGVDADDIEANYRVKDYTSFYSGAGEEVFNIITSGDVELIYNLELGTSTKDVYFIFTNTSLSSDTTAPYLLSSSIEASSYSAYPELKSISSVESKVSVDSVTGVRGKPEISDFNNDPWSYLDSVEPEITRREYKIKESSDYIAKNTSIVGDSISFMNRSVTDTIPATLKKIVTEHGKTVKIWVADDCWDGAASGKANYVTQAKVDALADKFLIAGDDNDIYEWVTSLFGAEWGAHNLPELIDENNQIHILLYDIDNDNSTTGGVLGYFWGKDNYKKSVMPNSNERVMFYVDAVLLATPVSEGEIVSTLAHELQHMIHFYQKIVLKNARVSDIWINEMCSLVTEDLLSGKMTVNGPRGVAYNTEDAGAAGNTSGRLPRFNYYNYAPVTLWTAEDKSLTSYSSSYAFGAYLARNYGGAQLFSDIVHNPYGNYRAVIDSVKKNGGAPNLTFGDLLRNWGAAVLLSDIITTAVPYRYNSGGWFTDPLGYTLGSINNYNYRYNSNDGPFLYTAAALDNLDKINRSSNIYVQAGTGVTGSQSWTFRMRDSVKLTVVVR